MYYKWTKNYFKIIIKKIMNNDLEISKLNIFVHNKCLIKWYIKSCNKIITINLVIKAYNLYTAKIRWINTLLF